MTEIEIAALFDADGEIKSVRKFGSGNINRTYCVETEGGKYLMQRLNTYVFPDYRGLMNNYYLVTEHLSKKGKPTLSLVKAKSGELFAEADGEIYRMYRYVEGATYDCAMTYDMMKELGSAFGEFQNDLADFDASQLIEPIKDFHNTAKRYENFEKAVSENLSGRACHVEKEIAFVRARKADCSLITDMLKSGEIPTRVTHNDTKLNNVLFDGKTGKPKCVIDLDTVMPGAAHYDFGDCIRSAANPAGEEELDLSKVGIDLGAFRAIAEGFLSKCGKSLTEKEIALLPFSAKLLTFECGMRFLTDYIDGDRYFRVEHPNHNLDRCRNQFRLVEDIKKHLDEMNAIVSEIISK